jgi:signal recognition particle subunit SRP54
MFESIRGDFRVLWRRILKQPLSQSAIREALRAITIILQRADAAPPVIADFAERIEAHVLWGQVLKSIHPGKQFIRIVHDQLIRLLGPVASSIRFAPTGPTVILMAGLRGSGKTSTCAKLALHLKDLGKRPLLVPVDLERPAASKELETLAGQIGVALHLEKAERATDLAKNAVQRAREEGLDVVILDTAGRHNLDGETVTEVRDIARDTSPREIFIVCDSLMGQGAVETARAFNQVIMVSGVILTRLDRDARGGAAISIQAVTGKPVVFLTAGEGVDATLEEFRPSEIAQRILGLRDDLSQDLERTLRKSLRLGANKQGSFTLEDFAEQIRKIKKLGSLKSLLKLVPGLAAQLEKIDPGEGELVRIQAIIQSMTPQERARPEIINSSRRERIASGSGTRRLDVDELIKQFMMMRKLMA